jgi:hypothetical protein
MELRIITSYNNIFPQGFARYSSWGSQRSSVIGSAHHIPSPGESTHEAHIH